MRTGTSRRARNAQPSGHVAPLVKKATQQKLRSSPRAAHAARVLLGAATGLGRRPSKGTISPRRRRKAVGSGESGGEKGTPEFDSDGTLSIVNGIRGMACDDDAGTDEHSPRRGSGCFRPFEGTEGLLLLSMIAEAQESCKARKRVKLPDMPARRCGYCGARNTVQWRSGPKETPILCNACGVKYRKGKLQLEDMKGRRLEIEDLENKAASDSVYPADLASANTNSSLLSRPALKAELESTKVYSQTKGPKLNAERQEFGGPHADMVAASFEQPAPGSPSLWGLMPPVLLPNQPGSIPILPPFGQMYSYTGGFRPILPVPSLMHTNGASVRNRGVWGSMSNSDWARFGFLPGHLGQFDGACAAKKVAPNKTMYETNRPEMEDCKEPLKHSLKDLNSNVQDGGVPVLPREASGTLRWLVKRKRTGPHPGD